QKSSLPVLIVPVGGLLLGGVLQPQPYVHDWVLVNVISSSLSNGVSVPYSDDLVAHVSSMHGQTEAICQKGMAKKPNIILLILESWSPYQSALFSGLNDWTPGIDSLARENTYFTRMYAGSFATSPGLMSILVGHEFWAPVKAARSFSTAWNTDATIPRGLRQNGYYSAFLTTGNLKFSSKAKWLEHIGFDYIEGHDHPAYEGKRRRHFDAVADEYLYERALAYVEEEVNDHQPYFLALENVSTHHPYIQPVTRSEEHTS